MKRACTLCACLLAIGLAFRIAPGAGQDATSSDDDPVLRALADELTRSVTGLCKQGEPLRRASYRATQRWWVSASASLGALYDSTVDRSHRLDLDLRLGDPKQDPTLESGDLGGYRGSEELPLEPDYALVRRLAWLATDDAYRDGSRSIAEQRVQRRTQIEASEPATWSDEPASTRLAPVSVPEIEARTARANAQLPELVRRLSRVLRERAEIRQSGAVAGYHALVRRFVTTDGMRIRDQSEMVRVEVELETQATDGSVLGTTVTAMARSLDGLASVDALEQKVKQSADALVELRAAPVAEPYVGPVLFEQDAGPQLAALVLASAFDGTPLPPELSRMSSAGGAVLADQLGQRILPKGMKIVDDPTLDKLDKQELFGRYEVDDDGVVAQRVELVNDGVLQGLLMSRRVRKQIAHSNGHARLGGVAPSNFLVSSNAGHDDKTLRKELLSEARKRGLSHAYIVRQFVSDRLGLEAIARSGRMGRERALPVFEIWEIKLSGEMRRVRNAIVAGVGLSRLRSALAVGREANVIALGSSSGQGASIASPAWLLGDVEIRRLEPGGEKPPELPNPLRAP
ncbi:MAG TPA: metallopeptidase TldD-related protein [Polyangiales bacterium]|nr:metallopeptidase TldD-related protein [Polyangiales bacterium]